jgi:hypothetical protein
LFNPGPILKEVVRYRPSAVTSFPLEVLTKV